MIENTNFLFRTQKSFAKKNTRFWSYDFHKLTVEMWNRTESSFCLISNLQRFFNLFLFSFLYCRCAFEQCFEDIEHITKSQWILVGPNWNGLATNWAAKRPNCWLCTGMPNTDHPSWRWSKWVSFSPFSHYPFPSCLLAFCRVYSTAFFFLCLNRFINDYSNFPADYAEVSTFSKAPSECSGTRSPAPYATTTLVGNSRLITVKNVNNQNMYFASDLYTPQTRYVHSESYFNPKEKINITENRLGCNTFNPNHHGALVGSGNGGGGRAGTHTAFSSIRKNRLKLLRNPHFRLGLGMDGGSNKHCGSGDSLNDSNGNLPTANGHGQEQLYVKIGEMNPASSEYDYSGMRWTQQPDQQYQQRQMHHDQQQQQQQSSPSYQSNQCMQQQQQHQHQQQLSTSSGQSSQSIYENHHRQNSASDKDMIYAPSSSNRSIISYMSSNKRFDEV